MCSRRTQWKLKSIALASLGIVGGCNAGGLPAGWHETPVGRGPLVVWDLEAQPLPLLPLPNDVGTWPDPGSPTGLRVNISMVAPTAIEARARELFDGLDGWSTFAAVSASFDAPIDTTDLSRRQGRGHYGRDAWGGHAVYVVNLQTGVPVPLDLDTGSYTYDLPNLDRFYENDPRGSESNLLFETVHEDVNGNRVLDPGEDTDFDGVLDEANTLDGRTTGDDVYDRMLRFYERETDTLILRPLVPLEESTRYAVVLTDRLRGRDGQPVRSPFPWVHALTQTDALAGLPSLFARKPALYGDLATRGWDGVAFAWTFTTQAVTRDLRTLREGLYGTGPFARLAEQFPARVTPVAAVGMGINLCEPGANRYAIPAQSVLDVLRDIGGEAFGLSPAQIEKLIGTYDQVSHFVLAFYESPYLMGDPDHIDLDEHWQLDSMTGEARISRDLVPMIIAVPKETPEHQQPFPVAFYGHGYGSMKVESLGFAGFMARRGIATVAIDSYSHGLPVDNTLVLALRALFDQACLAPMGNAILVDRARDQNGDGTVDSAGDFWSAYLFHTRDAVRQSVLDLVQGMRVLRAFDGRPSEPGVVPSRNVRVPDFAFAGDVDADGRIDAAGDFDADGTPDLGGPSTDYFAWGQSLGGILSPIFFGVEPNLVAAAPASGAGGATDVGFRNAEGGVRDAVMLRVLGPIIVSHPVDGPGEDTACDARGRSLRFIVPDLNADVSFEFACLPEETLGENDVVVIQNARTGEQRCAGVSADGRFRTALPADTDDRIVLDIYDDAAASIDFGTCHFDGPAPRLIDTVDTFRSGNARTAMPAPGTCRRCARYQTRTWETGDPLSSPVEGFGFLRQTPDLRRFVMIAQAAVDAGDPVNYARSAFLDPIASGGRSMLVMNSAGDPIVPTMTGNTLARAVGVLPFLPADAPDEFADWRAPDWFAAREGDASPADTLVRYHVIEGISRLRRHPVPGAEDFLVDVDNLSDGAQRFLANGRPSDAVESIAPPRPPMPLRWVRESRAWTAEDPDVWTAPAEHADRGISGVLNFYVAPRGNHGFEAVDVEKPWDEGEYLANLVADFFASRGTRLRYHSDPAGHLCLATSTCTD